MRLFHSPGLYVSILLATFAFVSCNESAEKQEHGQEGQESDKLPFSKYDIHSSFSEINKKFEGGLQLKSEIPADASLTQTVTNAVVFERQAQLEFNFRDGVLYSYYYTVYDTSDAAGLYNRIKEIYRDAYGEGREESAMQEQESRSAIWNTVEGEAVLTYIPETGMVSWGMQEQPQSM